MPSRRRSSTPLPLTAACLTQLVRNLVRLNGRDPRSYEANVLDDGSIAVRNAITAVYYPPDGWVSRFNRHLHRGFFEAPAVEAPAHAVPASA